MVLLFVVAEQKMRKRIFFFLHPTASPSVESLLKCSKKKIFPHIMTAHDFYRGSMVKVQLETPVCACKYRLFHKNTHTPKKKNCFCCPS